MLQFKRMNGVAWLAQKLQVIDASPQLTDTPIERGRSGGSHLTHAHATAKHAEYWSLIRTIPRCDKSRPLRISDLPSA